jgi:prepilin-type N-terminal cleavage/methylation domain-containing protein
MNASKTDRGFTLIETLVYLALFAIIIGGIMSAAYALFESSDRNQTKAMMQEEKDFMIAKIDMALTGAKTISAPAANASGSMLTLTKYDTTSATVGFTVVSGAFGNMWLNTSTNILNNSNVKISRVVFIHKAPGGTSPESVEAGFTITATTPQGSTISQTASTTRYIRI